MPDDLNVRYAAGWRSDGLYFFMEVDDPSRIPTDPSDIEHLYCGDAPEIYVDHDAVYDGPEGYADPGTRQVHSVGSSR